MSLTRNNIFKPTTEMGKQKLLIVILSWEPISENNALPFIDITSLPIYHARRHALLSQYKGNTSAIIACNYRNTIFDLFNFTNYGCDIEHALNLLKAQIISFSEKGSKFDKILIIGSGSYGTISDELKDTLSKLINNNMSAEGTIRIQICNFSGFATILKKMVPMDNLNNPDAYSIISKYDTRAIDLDTDSDNFKHLKCKFKEFLKKSFSTDAIISKIHTFFDKFPNIKVDNIYIIGENGEKTPVPKKQSVFKIS